MGRTASGVRGIKLDKDGDEVIGMICIENKEDNVLVVSEKGLDSKRLAYIILIQY